MSYTESIENLLEEIELHESPLSEGESLFLERLTAHFEESGTLESDEVVALYELLDRLDNRAERGSSNYSYADAGEDDDYRYADISDFDDED
jgi:hypothetical protein